MRLSVAVDNPDVIDVVSTTRANGEVVLTIADHLEWDDEHLLVLQVKINRYVEFIEGGQLAEEYPNAKPGVPVRIEVACKYPPSIEGLRFLNLAKDAIQSAGWGLTWSVSRESRSKRRSTRRQK
jgi:hypothetical protein